MALLAGAAMLTGTLAGGACRTPPKQTGEGAPAVAQELSSIPIRERGGAQLWGDNCARCHNSRSPGEFTDEQWDVIAHHMRVRANLTPYEHEMILKFLQSAN
jgi:hypothetical protein